MFKVPSFPVFEEWRKNSCKFDTKIGDYNFVIEPFCWSCGDGPTTYAAAISTDDVPLNIYARKAIYTSEKIYPGDSKKLEEWYNETVSYLTREWKKYLTEKYFDGGEPI